MKKNPIVNFLLAGVDLTSFGFKIPSPFARLNITNGQVTSATQWTLTCIVGGDSREKVNIASFEALLYSAAQSAAGYSNSSGIPVSFLFGWQDENGNVDSFQTYQGFTLKFTTSTDGMFMTYEITGYASLAVQSQMPVLNVPELCGFVQPSAVVEGLAKASKADLYYDLDIDHNDSPTLVNHGALTTSFNSYVRGSYSGQDDYDSFPGLLKLSKSYNLTRTSAGISRKFKSLGQILDCVKGSILDCLKPGIGDETVQSSSFSYWVDEPSMTQRGCIHYKSNAGILGMHISDVLQYGTADTNILSLSGSYNGVAYNMTDMNFTSLGFNLDASGNAIANTGTIVNSWSSSLANVFQTANIINDVNAIATQFSGEFTIQIPGSVKVYEIAQPISLLVVSGNTISPITGIYNIIEVSHEISSTFVTSLKIQRLVTSTANEVASSQGLYIRGSSSYPSTSFRQTSNIISTSKVDFGTIYPDYTHLSLNV